MKQSEILSELNKLFETQRKQDIEFFLRLQTIFHLICTQDEINYANSLISRYFKHG